MTVALKHADRPHSSILPRPTRDPMHNKHGPLLPMQTPCRSLWQRITGRQP